MNLLNLNNHLSILLSFVLAFMVVLTSIPTIVEVARAKRLYDEPGKRKSHTLSVPTLGGVAIFSGIILSITLLTNFKENSEFQFVVASAILLFFVGIKDDVLIIAPLKKLGGQILAVLIIVILGDVRFTSLHGFLGIHHIPYLASLLLTLFVFIVIINGFNLIDGIDGLASGIGIISSLVFGVWFYLSNEFDFAIIAISITGGLIPFFIYNVFGKSNKIFMGDTGSLILGFFIAVLAVRFNEMNIPDTGKYFIHAAPSVSFGILIVPLFDTMRVFVIRIVKGRSPFRADKNHVHHKLLAMGFSHLKSTVFILVANIIIIIIVLLLNKWGIIDLMLLMISLAILLSILPEIVYFIKQKQQEIAKM